ALVKAEPGEADAVAVRWLWLLVGVLGFAPQLDACVRDGNPVSGTVAFSTAEGGVLCASCAGVQPPTKLPPQAYRDLLALNDEQAALPALDAAHAAAHRRLVARLIIAADEGIMPQTEEHLAIVELLGVRRGIPVLTKRDLVDDEWLALVRTEVAARLERSRIPWRAPIAVSALKSEGLEDLKRALVEVAADLTDRPADDLFRLPIDRVFALAGAGT